MAWFDRKFDFQNISTTFPIIMERLAGTPVRLEAKIKSISAPNLTHKIADSWSIQEQVGHLLDLEPLWLGRVQDFESGQPILREADLSNQKTHQARHNQKQIEEIFMDFKTHRSKLVVALRSLEERAASLVSKHPRLGTPMRLMDLAYFVAEHDDHHLVSMNNIMDQLLAK